MLTINDEQFIERAEIIWEKGTNRSAFFRGEIDKYGWVDIGSSFLPSEVVSAFLFAQLEHLDDIQNKRKLLWDNYHMAFETIANPSFNLPNIPSYATNNAHMFYLTCKTPELRNNLIQTLKKMGFWQYFIINPFMLVLIIQTNMMGENFLIVITMLSAWFGYLYFMI